LKRKGTKARDAIQRAGLIVKRLSDAHFDRVLLSVKTKREESRESEEGRRDGRTQSRKTTHDWKSDDPTFPFKVEFPSLEW